jgi:hypothetical protein
LIKWHDLGKNYVDKQNKHLNDRVDNLDLKINDILSKLELITLLMKK